MLTHSFNIEFATKYGLEESIVMWHICYWCEHNRDNDRNHHDGLYWTFNSVKAFKETFPYMKPYTIKKVLKNLEDRGFIKTGNYNDTSYDRTTWYAVTDLGYSEFNNTDGDKTENALCENDKSICRKLTMDCSKTNNGLVENAQPIPNKNQINNQINNTNILYGAKRKDVPSSLDEAKQYAEKMGYYDFDVESWFDFNESRGWKMKSGAIKDWKACLRTAYRSGYNKKSAYDSNDPHPLNPRANRIDTEIPF